MTPWVQLGPYSVNLDLVTDIKDLTRPNGDVGLSLHWPTSGDKKAGIDYTTDPGDMSDNAVEGRRIIEMIREFVRVRVAWTEVVTEEQSALWPNAKPKC